jgi:hypothetical protein
MSRWCEARNLPGSWSSPWVLSSMVGLGHPSGVGDVVVDEVWPESEGTRVVVQGRMVADGSPVLLTFTADTVVKVWPFPTARVR